MTRLPEIIAHRGASHGAPENTLAALRLAWDEGADAVEIDVRLSRDGVPVVIHDDTTARTAGADGRVAQMTLAELRALDAGSWKGPRWAGERIPTLAEALAQVLPRRRVFVEVKCGAEVLPALRRDVEASNLASAQVALIGFSLDVMRAAKQSLPSCEACWIPGPRADGTIPTPGEVVAWALEARLDGIDVEFRALLAVGAAGVAAAHSAGLKVHAWTVDDADAARELAAAGVDGLTTNRPAWLRAALE